jgi:hypothetical protein
MKLSSGQIIRHKGERKVIRRVWRDEHGDVIIEFLDRTKSINYQDMEEDGRK